MSEFDPIGQGAPRATPASPTEDFGFPGVLPAGAGSAAPATGTGQPLQLGPSGDLRHAVDVLKEMQEQRRGGAELLEQELDEAAHLIRDQIVDIVNFQLPHAGMSERIFNPNYKSDKAIAEARIKANALQSLLPALTDIFQQRRLLNEPDEFERRVGSLVESQAKLEIKTAQRSQAVEQYNALARESGGREIDPITALNFIHGAGQLESLDELEEGPGLIEQKRAADLGYSVGLKGLGTLFPGDGPNTEALRQIAEAGARERARHDKEPDVDFASGYPTLGKAQTAVFEMADDLRKAAPERMVLHKFMDEHPVTRRKYERTVWRRKSTLALDDAVMQAIQRLGLGDKIGEIAPHLVSRVGLQQGVVPAGAKSRLDAARKILESRGDAGR